MGEGRAGTSGAGPRGSGKTMQGSNETGRCGRALLPAESSRQSSQHTFILLLRLLPEGGGRPPSLVRMRGETACPSESQSLRTFQTHLTPALHFIDKDTKAWRRNNLAQDRVEPGFEPAASQSCYSAQQRAQDCPRQPTPTPQPVCFHSARRKLSAH